MNRIENEGRERRKEEKVRESRQREGDVWVDVRRRVKMDERSMFIW